MNLRSVWRSMPRAFAAVLLLSVAGCAEFAELISFEDADQKAEAARQADTASLWEMTLMAGRYGVMLDQAREILKLPEQRDGGATFPTDDTNDAKQRQALAEYQTRVVDEFAIDVGRACARGRVPKDIRALACDQKKKLTPDLRTAVSPEMQALAVRNDRVGEFVMPWWDAVCAKAPKPKSDEDVPACVME
jgi:hypothetical protein